MYAIRSYYEIHNFVVIKEVPKGVSRFGTVPVNPESAEKAGTFLIGCDIGENGSDIPELEKIGAKILKESDLPTLLYVITSYSIHYTKLYEFVLSAISPELFWFT